MKAADECKQLSQAGARGRGAASGIRQRSGPVCSPDRLQVRSSLGSRRLPSGLPGYAGGRRAAQGRPALASYLGAEKRHGRVRCWLRVKRQAVSPGPNALHTWGAAADRGRTCGWSEPAYALACVRSATAHGEHTHFTNRAWMMRSVWPPVILWHGGMQCQPAWAQAAAAVHRISLGGMGCTQQPSSCWY